MTVQEHVVHVSREVAEEFFRYVETTPGDRLEWKPLDQGQSILSMAREIAVTPEWAVSVISDNQPTEAERTSKEQMATWNTLAHCRAEFEKRFAIWSAIVLQMNDEDLTKTKFLPFNGGRDHTLLELLEYPRWNTTYHLGQIAYIQTLYGDREVYFVAQQ